MPANAVVGLKPDTDDSPLIELTTSVLDAGGRIHLVTLVQVGKEGDEHERLETAREHAESLAARLRADGLDVQVTAQISAIGLGAELASIAGNLGADLLVIGLGKRSRVGKALLGSDAQSALLTAPCPVLSTRLN